MIDFATALRAKLPFVSIHTDDPVHVKHVLKAISGGKTLMELTGHNLKLSDQYLWWTENLDQVTAKMYRLLSEATATTVIINPPTPSMLVFDTGVLQTPSLFFETYLSEFAGKDQIPALVYVLKGLSLKGAQEVVQLTMARTGAITPNEVRKTRQMLGGDHPGLSTLDTEFDFYEWPKPLKEWLDLNNAYFLDLQTPAKLVPRGLLLAGEPGCLAEDTEVFYSRRSGRQAGRILTLAEFYRKFNGIDPGWDLTRDTFLHSFNDDNSVSWNTVVGVYQSGVKAQVQVTFDDGTVLKATPDHPVMTPNGFIQAGALAVHQEVVGRGSMRPQSSGGRDWSNQPPRIMVNTKWHPYGSFKDVSGYHYMRVHRARLVVEADLNSLPYDEFAHALKHNQVLSNTFRYLPQDWDVHHKDENTLNDDLGNLVVMPHAEHARIHAKFEQFHTEFVRKVSVQQVTGCGTGMTYDVQMESPANNFCANGIVVHNTGKTMAARVLAKHWDVPLLRLDVSTSLNRWLGESESRIARNLSLIEASAPCVWLLDEAEKLFGTGGEEGTTQRILSQMLWWLQDHKSRVLTIMTTNNLGILPKELYRAERIDKVIEIDKLSLSAAKLFAVRVYESVLGTKIPMKRQKWLRDRMDSLDKGMFAHGDIRVLVYESIKSQGWLQEEK